jgi:biopolymer transport protein ExbD
MSRRRRRRLAPEGVRLNMAAMLDMAFQLLAFFIATFKPMTIEQQIALKLPPPEKMATEKPSDNNPSKEIQTMLQTMRIGVEATPDGELSSIQFLDDQSRARSLEDLQGKMKTKLEASYKGSSPIEQIVLEIDPRLHLQVTMEVMDRCLHQKTKDGKQLTKISPILARLGGGAAK